MPTIATRAFINCLQRTSVEKVIHVVYCMCKQCSRHINVHKCLKLHRYNCHKASWAHWGSAGYGNGYSVDMDYNLYNHLVNNYTSTIADIKYIHVHHTCHWRKNRSNIVNVGTDSVAKNSISYTMQDTLSQLAQLADKLHLWGVPPSVY